MTPKQKIVSACPIGKDIFDIADNVSAVATVEAVVAAGATPTKEEFDAVVSLLNETRAQLNALLVALKG